MSSKVSAAPPRPQTRRSGSAFFPARALALGAGGWRSGVGHVGRVGFHDLVDPVQALVTISLGSAFQFRLTLLPSRLSPGLRAATSQEAHTPLREAHVSSRRAAAPPLRALHASTKPCLNVRLEGAGPGIDYRVLGPLEVSANSRAI